MSAFNFELLTERKSDFYEEMQKLLRQKGYKTRVLMPKDVQSMGSEALIVGAHQDEIAKVSNITLKTTQGGLPASRAERNKSSS